MQLVGAIIGGIVAAILVVSVAYPVIKETASNQSATATGTQKTLLDLLPTMVAIGALVTIVAFFVTSKL